MCGEKTHIYWDIVNSSLTLEKFNKVEGRDLVRPGSDSSTVHGSSPPVRLTPALVGYGINTPLDVRRQRSMASPSPNGSTPYSAVDFTVGYPLNGCVYVCVSVCECMIVWFSVQL